MDLELWALCDRRKRVDALGLHVIKLVEEYWTCNTRISSKRKDVVKKRIGARHWVNHPTHHLQESQVSHNKYSGFGWNLKICRGTVIPFRVLLQLRVITIAVLLV